jgi:hypothetical protein
MLTGTFCFYKLIEAKIATGVAALMTRRITPEFMVEVQELIVKILQEDITEHSRRTRQFLKALGLPV